MPISFLFYASSVIPEGVSANLTKNEGRCLFLDADGTHRDTPNWSNNNLAELALAARDWATSSSG